MNDPFDNVALNAIIESRHGADSASANNAQYLVETAMARAALGLAEEGQIDKANQIAENLQRKGWDVSTIEDVTESASYADMARTIAIGIGLALLAAVAYLIAAPQRKR